LSGADLKTKTLDWAMDRIARLTKQTRDATFQETWATRDAEGQAVNKKVNHTLRIASLGGAGLKLAETDLGRMRATLRTLGGKGGARHQSVGHCNLLKNRSSDMEVAEVPTISKTNCPYGLNQLD
jgi:hypothetical protein